jgi:hypothetical protein
MEANTRCAHEAGAEADAGVGAADVRGASDGGITMDVAGTEAMLALGVSALPVPRPKLHPAHAAATANAIATDRKAAGNDRFGMLSVTSAMLRTISGSVPPSPHRVTKRMTHWSGSYWYSRTSTTIADSSLSGLCSRRGQRIPAALAPSRPWDRVRNGTIVGRLTPTMATSQALTGHSNGAIAARAVMAGVEPLERLPCF